jgi:hypothetical protein
VHLADLAFSFPPFSRTRAPFLLDCRPSVASSTPSFAMSAMNVPIWAMFSWVGGTPSSTLFVSTGL